MPVVKLQDLLRQQLAASRMMAELEATLQERGYVRLSHDEFLKVADSDMAEAELRVLSELAARSGWPT